MFFFWNTSWPLGYGVIKHRDQPRCVGAEIISKKVLGLCRRAIRSITRIRLRQSGDVEENPGPSLRGMQWNSSGLTQAKRLVLHKTLLEENVTFCLLSETKLSCAEVSSFTIAGYQHHGAPHPSKGGGVLILVREDLPVEVGLTVVASVGHAHCNDPHIRRSGAHSNVRILFPPERYHTQHRNLTSF
ncbi:Tbingi protein [Trypanosoma theileri]|uniref:Tbingi protein n=1 Tax=Trypanosoma theileri TaxID=67003 RepID=A0A1X0P2V1_9TRYP|nr:Tbingi protein [Trypanosoma theileri]ORC91257.1 Tbingi protein [Trypanosoma theileri]